MNRLTERKENGVINVRYATEHETAIHRLTSIEDILGDTYDLDRLRDLVQADRDGRCEIHAAKDGDTVYSIFAYVNGLHVRKSNGEPITKIVPCVVDDFTRATVDREFGKTVFRTREDAEQALREWESKKRESADGYGSSNLNGKEGWNEWQKKFVRTVEKCLRLGRKRSFVLRVGRDG